MRRTKFSLILFCAGLRVPLTPEDKARVEIDANLVEAGWLVQSRDDLDLTAGRGVAVRNFKMKTGYGFADYLLYVDRKGIGAVEAKADGTLTGVEAQSAKYGAGLPDNLPAFAQPLPFLFESNGKVTYFTNGLDPTPRSRPVFNFPRPETLAEWALQPHQLRARLRALPELNEEGLWKVQGRAIRKLEESFARADSRALIQMATGSGKTFTAVNVAYRLLKFGGAKRILFLVDRDNLGKQAEDEFANFEPPDDPRGLFVEISPEKLRKPTSVKVFAGEESFDSPPVQHIERDGVWYFPPIASLITAGGRLLLAMLERSVADKQGTYLFCDTDSLCIVSSQNGQAVTCTGGKQRGHGIEAIKAISWGEVDQIVDKFADLNPYDPDIVHGPILKVEKVNWDSQGRRQLYGCAISAKRYVLYRPNGADDVEIVDPKAHGLGYLFSPKRRTEDEQGEKVARWVFEAWEALLRHELGLASTKPKWLNVPAMMRVVINIPEVMKRLLDQPWLRPYNFLLCPMIDNVAGYPMNVDSNRFLLVAAFTDQRARWLGLDYMNIHDGKHYRLALQQSARLDKVIPQTFG